MDLYTRREAVKMSRHKVREEEKVSFFLQERAGEFFYFGVRRARVTPGKGWR
jgi:hypothetical protein